MGKTSHRFLTLLILGGIFLPPVIPAQAGIHPGSVSVIHVAAKKVVLKPDAGPFVPNANEFATAIVMIPGSHQVLYSFKPDKPWVAASLTKLANALAFFRSPPSLFKVVAMKKVDEVGGGRLRVSTGATMRVIDLVYSTITASANNTATAMARITGVTTKTYLARMNAEAKKAGATKSVFYDFSGMNEKNMTTARDMALLAERAFQNKAIQRAASTDVYSFPVINSGVRHTIKNTNDLLTKDPDVYIVGGKTGYLDESKYNLVVQVRPMLADGTGDKKKEVIVVVFGAPTKEGQFTAAKRLATWAWENHEF